MTAIEPDRTIFGSPESLEKHWDEYCNAPKDERYCIKEPFLMFPKGTSDFEICEWFNKMHPGGLPELMKKRMVKKFGEKYATSFENLIKASRVAVFISDSPDLARTCEFQAENRGHRMSIQPVDDAACLTEEDKKRLFQEFAEEIK